MGNHNIDFPTCAICCSDSWRMVHEGPIRDGTIGVWREVRACRWDTCRAYNCYLIAYRAHNGDSR